MAEDTARIILNLEVELQQPDTRRSTERLGELIADDFLEIGESGKRYRKSDLLQMLPGSMPLKFTIQEFAVVSIADETVLATYRLVKEDLNSGEAHSSLRSSLWLHRDRRWQIRFHQGTMVKHGAN
jgi:hypothetical protein